MGAPGRRRGRRVGRPTTRGSAAWLIARRAGRSRRSRARTPRRRPRSPPRRPRRASAPAAEARSTLLATPASRKPASRAPPVDRPRPSGRAMACSRQRSSSACTTRRCQRATIPRASARAARRYQGSRFRRPRQKASASRASATEVPHGASVSTSNAGRGRTRQVGANIVKALQSAQDERDAREVDGRRVVREELGERPGGQSRRPNGVRMSVARAG